jgi:TATA-binding protein-associated factor
LILTGTPVQNKVHEVWATFDFLMPNFLGSSSGFSSEFAKPITKSQLPGASALEVANGMEKLKILHQQVLPFILRREKEHVLKELPPKSITTIPCDMSIAQMRLYSEFCSGTQAKQSLKALQRALDAKNPEADALPRLGSNVLKSLLYLRLLCTHPSLVNTKGDQRASSDTEKLYSIESSGKLMALKEILRDAGIQPQELMAADNDSSLLYCEEDDNSDGDELEDVLHSTPDDFIKKPESDSSSKCLVFAQFTHSLDLVEELLLKRHMPSVRYIRLDGRVPSEKRSGIVDLFNKDESIKVMLLTTRIGGLGLNLTGKLAVSRIFIFVLSKLSIASFAQVPTLSSSWNMIGILMRISRRWIERIE